MGVLEPLSNEEIALLCDSFVRVDSHHDGFVAPAQLPTFLAQHFPTVDGATLDRVRNILAETRRAADGSVDVREFVLLVRDGRADALRSLLDPDEAGDDPEYTQVRNIMARLQPDELDMYRDAFIKLDANGDGMLDPEEVMNGCAAVLRERFPPMRGYLEKIFAVADKDGDGMLCLREFMGSFADGPGAVPHEVVLDATALVRLRLTDDEIAQLQMTFRDIDSNGDGYLDRAELKAGLKRELAAQYPRHTDAQFDELVSVVLAAADRDRDGKLNISEFIRSFQEEQGVLPSSFMQPAPATASAAAGQQEQSQSQQRAAGNANGNGNGVRLTKEQHQYLAQAFANMDTNQDGFLDSAELRQAVTNCVMAMMPERADERAAIDRVVAVILRVGDVNRDGAISWKEFVRAFTHNTEIVDILEEVAEVGHSGFQARLAPEEVANLKSAFASLDRNGDGYVSRRELAASVRLLVDSSRMRREVVQELVDAIMAEADADGDGKLTLSEFVRAFAAGSNDIMDIGYAAAVASDVAKRMATAKQLSREQLAALKEAFAALDRNRDGFVDAVELRSAIFSLLQAEYEDEEEVRDLVDIILSAADSNHDGRLSLTEFIRAFTKHADVMLVPVAAADALLSTRERVASVLSAEEIAALRAAFVALDANHDGVLDAKEFAKAVNLVVERSVQRRGLVPEVVRILMDAADVDRDGRVTLDEFLTAFADQPEVMSVSFAAACAKQAALKAKRVLSPQQVAALKDAFATLDANGDGFVDRKELLGAIRGIIDQAVGDRAGREQFANDLADLVLRAADRNRDGKLTLTEFVRAFLQHADVMSVAAEAANQKQADVVARLRSRLMDDEIEQLCYMFATLDTNQDGELDPAELKAGVAQVLGSSFASAQALDEVVQNILLVCDRDGNGRLSMNEFLSAFDAAPEAIDGRMAAVVGGIMSDRVRHIKSHLLQSEVEALKRTFAVLDQNNDGYLDAQELENAVRSLLSRGLVSEKNVDSIVRAILEAALGANSKNSSSSSSKRISLGEFVHAFETVPNVMSITQEAADAIQAHARLVRTIPTDAYEALRVAFATLDKNGDGFLSREELSAAISALVADSLQGHPAGNIDGVVDLILSTASSRHDGRITLEDFVTNFVTHHDVMTAPVAAAVNIIQRRESGGGAAAAAAASATAAQQKEQQQNRARTLVPTPPADTSAVAATAQSLQQVSPVSSSNAGSGRRRNLSRPGATTRELMVEASPIVNDVSGVPISDQQLRIQFDSLDKSGDGRLQKSEFKNFYLGLESYGLPMTDGQFESAWTKICGARESTLNFERFALFMLSRSRM